MGPLFAVLAVLAFVTSFSASVQAAQGGVRVGLLSCQTVPGSGRSLLVASSVEVRCKFETSAAVEYYRGETGIGLGLDVDVGREAEIAFTVLSATKDLGPGAYVLAGRYVGAKGSVTAGVGVGAAALVGGGKKSITLQPIAIESSTGLGIAAGLTYLTLEPDPGGSVSLEQSEREPRQLTLRSWRGVVAALPLV